MSDCFIIELQYNHVLTYDIKLHCTHCVLHMKTLHPNFEVIMNVNRLSKAETYNI